MKERSEEADLLNEFDDTRLDPPKVPPPPPRFVREGFSSPLFEDPRRSLERLKEAVENVEEARELFRV